MNTNTKGSYSAACDAGPAIVGKGDKVRFYNNGEADVWENMSDYGIDGNWNIKMYVEPYIEPEPEDTTSILNVVKPELSVYPNPAKSSITIKSDELINHLYLIGINGQVVINKTMNTYNQNINIEGVKPGIYFVKIVSPNGYNFEKLIIE